MKTRHDGAHKCDCTRCRRQDPSRFGCGSCFHGALIGVNDTEIQRCDECALFPDDESAVLAVRAALRKVGRLFPPPRKTVW